MRKKRVFHTPQDHKELLLAAAILHFNPPYMHWTKALLKVNESAPEEKKLGKGTIYTNSVQWLLEVKSYIPELYPSPIQAETSKVPPEGQPQLKNADELETFLEKFSDKISNQLFERIREKLETKLREYEISYERVITPTVPAEQVTVSQKKILVVGLLPIQQAEISKTYHNDFRLKYHESDENIHRLEDRVKWADTVILNCTKISHKHQDMVKKFSGDREIKLVFGGVSAIKGTLEGLKTKCQITHQQ
jgi:hypothetical protein